MKRQLMWEAGGFASTTQGTVSGLPSTSVYSFWARLALGTSVPAMVVAWRWSLSLVVRPLDLMERVSGEERFGSKGFCRFFVG